MHLRHRSAAGLGLVLLALAGCGSSDGINRGGELSGVVRIDGRPLGGGRVEVFSGDGKHSVGCEIRPDGSYTVNEPPLGPCKITVKTSYLQGMPAVPKGGKGGPQGSSPGIILPKDVGLVYTPIPAKYEELSTTDLTVTVEPGKQSHDIDLARKG
jgi:hypothetical protein